MAIPIGERAPGFELPGTDGADHSLAEDGAPGDGRLLDLQPLPLRARLARPHARRRSRLRRSRRSLPGDQLQRRRALSGRLLRGDGRASRERGGVAAPLPPRREPGGGAGMGCREDPARVRARPRAEAALPRRARRRLRGRLARRGLGRARRSTPCSRGASPSAPRPPPSAAGSNGKRETAVRRSGRARSAPPGPRPRLLGQPGAGLRRAGGGAGDTPRAGGGGGGLLLGRGRRARRAAGPLQPLRARLRVAAPGRRDRLPDPQRDPARRRARLERRGDRRRAAGRRPPLRAGAGERRPARPRGRDRGPPRQRRRRDPRRLRALLAGGRGRQRHPPRPARGRRGRGGDPLRAGPDREGARGDP